MSCSDRVAVVTGASRGIGRAIAHRLAVAGYDLGLVADEPLSDTVVEVRELGRSVASVVADFRDPGSAADAVDRIAVQLGRLDALVNNAGITVSVPCEHVQWDELVEVFNVNFFAGYLGIRAAIPHLRRAGGGSIVNVSSIHSRSGMSGHSVYAATKGAINAATRELAVELAPERIRVNAVLPGIIEIPAYFADPKYSTERAGAVVPWGRPGRPADVAAAVAFLVSEDADFITGECLGVDGGLGALMPIRLGDLFG